MKKTIWGLLTFVTASTTFAADGVVSCEKLKRQTDRNTCIAEFVKQISQTKQPPLPSAEPADRADVARREAEAILTRAKDVLVAFDSTLSVTTHGVSYNDYSPYIQKVAIELDRYRQGNRSPAEEEAGDRLSNALDALKDAREYWAADIKFYSRRDNRLAYSGGLPVALSGMGRIVSKYGLPKQKSDWLGLHQGVPRAVALTALWQFASEEVAAARAALEPQKIAASSIPETIAEDPDSGLKKRVSELFQHANCTASNIIVGKPIRERQTASTKCSSGSILVAACDADRCELTEDTSYTDQFFGIVR